MNHSNRCAFVAGHALAAFLVLALGTCGQGTPSTQPSVVAADWPRDGQEGPIWREFFDGDAPVECVYMIEKKAVTPTSAPSGHRPSTAFEEKRVVFVRGSPIYDALRRALQEVVLIPYDQAPARYREGYENGEAVRGLVTFPDEPSPYHIILKHQTRSGGYIRMAVRDHYYPTVMVKLPDDAENVFWASDGIGRWLRLALEMRG